MKRVLITGITGFAGSHLAEHLASKNEYEISGTFLIDESLINIKAIKDKVNPVKLDLNDKNRVFSIIKSIKPDLIFHLAAFTSPFDSFKNPTETILNNIAIQLNILEAIRDANLDSRILIVSSADVYGLVSKKDLPINEHMEFKPTNPYAVSKITQDYLGLQYFLSFKMNIIRVRPFNHIGPRQSPHFVVSSFAKSIAEIEKGKTPIIHVGNLDSKRDFTDVRDMVRAYSLILDKGKIGDVYNIGRGISYKIEEILNKLLSLSTIKIKVENDPKRIRPSDNPELVCDSSKVKALIGWSSEISIDQTLKDTLDYWKKIV